MIYTCIHTYTHVHTVPTGLEDRSSLSALQYFARFGEHLIMNRESLRPLEPRIPFRGQAGLPPVECWYDASKTQGQECKMA